MPILAPALWAEVKIPRGVAARVFGYMLRNAMHICLQNTPLKVCSDKQLTFGPITSHEYTQIGICTKMENAVS